jgi:hypothetical protein
MGQTARTTKLLLDLSPRGQGETNPGKREHLAATVDILNAARQFYPTRYNRYFERRRAEPGWETKSPTFILNKQTAAIHFLQSKAITAKKIVESKRDPDLVTRNVFHSVHV